MNSKQNAYTSELHNHDSKNSPLDNQLSFKLLTVNSHLSMATVTISHTLVEQFYTLAAHNQQKIVSVSGFEKGTVPLEYIRKNYQETLASHLQEMLFKLFAINYLYAQIHEQNLIIGGEPRLVETCVMPEKDASFLFEMNLLPDYQIPEWKYIPFKAPKRKRYKDLDKQVQHFLDTEASQNNGNEKINYNDWVLFSLTLSKEDACAPLACEPQYFWFHLGKEDTEGELRLLFVGRSVGEKIVSNNKALQEYFSSHLQTSYYFIILIEDCIHADTIDFELVKKHFKLKTNKALHQKLIEIFSYRNDLSLRRSMAQDVLKTILNKYPVTPPTAMVLRKQEDLLDAVKNNPDYNVYRTEKNFNTYLEQLAKKQCCEEIIIDSIAAQEGIKISNDDVRNYLNLFKRARSKEFIYFRIPSFTIQNQQVPAPAHEIMHYCLREKTLNHIIYHLTKD